MECASMIREGEGCLESKRPRKRAKEEFDKIGKSLLY